MTQKQMLQIQVMLLQQDDLCVNWYNIQQRCQVMMIQIQKYPFYACELLCFGVPQITEVFFGEDKKLLILLFQFLTQHHEINAVLAGYVCKVLFTLSKLRSEQFYSEIFSYPEIVSGLVRHLQSRLICEVIIKILTLERESTEDYSEFRLQLLGDVLESINQEFEISTNAAQILHELIQRVHMIASPQQITDVLFSSVANLHNIFPASKYWGQRSCVETQNKQVAFRIAR